MSYANNPNDPNYVTPGTVPPVVEAVEPAGSNLRWLWWLLGLLVLAGLIWALTRACRTNEACTTVPATIWTTTAQTEAYNAAVGWVPAGTSQQVVTTALRRACEYRLTAGTGWENRIAEAFSGVAGFDTANNAAIQSYINGANWCRCS